MHLMLIGRRDHSLPISTLRAKDLLTEIRPQDLRFAVAETEMFLEQVLEIPIDPFTSVAVEKKPKAG